MAPYTPLVKDLIHIGRFLNYLGCFSFIFSCTNTLREFSDCQFSVPFFCWRIILSLTKVLLSSFYYSKIKSVPYVLIKSFVGDLNGLIHPILTFINRKSFIQLIFEIDFYDVQAKSLNHSDKKTIHGNNFGKYSIVSMIIFFLVFELFLASLIYVTPKLSFSQNHFIAEHNTLFFVLLLVLFSQNTLNFLPFIFPFILFSHEITLRFKRFRESFCDAMKNSCSETSFDHYRLLYFQLCKALDDFNAYFGSQVMFFFFISFFLLLVYSGEIVGRISTNLSIFILIKILLEVYIVSRFSEVLEKECDAVIYAFSNTTISKMSLRGQEAVHLFILQLQYSKRKVYASNHSSVNKTSFVSVLVSVVGFIPLYLNLFQNISKS